MSCERRTVQEGSIQSIEFRSNTHGRNTLLFIGQDMSWTWTTQCAVPSCPRFRRLNRLGTFALLFWTTFKIFVPTRYPALSNRADGLRALQSSAVMAARGCVARPCAKFRVLVQARLRSAGPFANSSRPRRAAAPPPRVSRCCHRSKPRAGRNSFAASFSIPAFSLAAFSLAAFSVAAQASSSALFVFNRRASATASAPSPVPARAGRRRLGGGREGRAVWAVSLLRGQLAVVERNVGRRGRRVAPRRGAGPDGRLGRRRGAHRRRRAAVLGCCGVLRRVRSAVPARRERHAGCSARQRGVLSVHGVRDRPAGAGGGSGAVALPARPRRRLRFSVRQLVDRARERLPRLGGAGSHVRRVARRGHRAAIRQRVGVRSSPSPHAFTSTHARRALWCTHELF